MTPASSSPGSGPLSGANWFEHLSHCKAPQLRVFCFPYAGGSADVFRCWQRWFPEQLDVCLVHLPGRGKSVRERAFTRLLPLVKAVADRIQEEIDVPYILYGHSMGALISFDLAHELRQRNQPEPRHLLVSGRRAPQWPSSERRTFDLPHDEFISELKRLKGTPQEVLDNPELMELFMDLLRADFAIAESYECRPCEPLSCPITVYGGVDDDHVSLESCRAWQKQTSSSCRVRMFKGDHFFIRNPGPEFIKAFRNDVLSAVPSPLTRTIG